MLFSLPKRKDDQPSYQKYYSKQNKKSLAGSLPFGIVEYFSRLEK